MGLIDIHDTVCRWGESHAATMGIRLNTGRLFNGNSLAGSAASAEVCALLNAVLVNYLFVVQMRN